MYDQECAGDDRRYDLEPIHGIYLGDRWRLPIWLAEVSLDANGEPTGPETPTNLTGKTVRCQLRSQRNAPGSPVATVTVTVVNASQGQIQLSLSKTQTGALEPREHLWYDIEIQGSDPEDVTTVMYGRIPLRGQVTY